MTQKDIYYYHIILSSSMKNNNNNYLRTNYAKYEYNGAGNK